MALELRRSLLFVLLVLAVASSATRPMSGSAHAGEPETSPAALIEIEVPDAMLLAWATFAAATGEAAPYTLVSVETTTNDHEVTLLHTSQEGTQTDRKLRAEAMTWLKQIPAVATLCARPPSWSLETRLSPPVSKVEAVLPQLGGRSRRVAEESLSLSDARLRFEANVWLQGIVDVLVPDEDAHPDLVKLRTPFTTGPGRCELRRRTGTTTEVELVSCAQLCGVRVAGLHRDELLGALFNLSLSRDWMVVRVKIMAQPPASWDARPYKTRYVLFIDGVYLPVPADAK
ncbi:MAG: hypothetical protein R3F05_19345 [Planctomycetota bacterium]